MARRSVLFSPGDKPDLLRKAPDSGADVVVFDLEDAVAPGAKDSAREAVSDVLTALDAECEVCVRVSPPAHGGAADVAAALQTPETVDALVVPKVGGPADISAINELMAEEGAIRPLYALIETAAGVLAAEDIAATEPVDAVIFGAEDLAADVGATETPSAYARERVVLAASAAGVDAIDTVYTDYEDEAGLRAETEAALALGYDGKLAIHPAQVPVINEAFTPVPDRVAWAERVLEARDEAAAQDRGVFAVDGEMIDAPLVAQAERILERAAAAGDATAASGGEGADSDGG